MCTEPNQFCSNNKCIERQSSVVIQWNKSQRRQFGCMYWCMTVDVDSFINVHVFIKLSSLCIQKSAVTKLTQSFIVRDTMLFCVGIIALSSYNSDYFSVNRFSVVGLIPC